MMRFLKDLRSFVRLGLVAAAVLFVIFVPGHTFWRHSPPPCANTICPGINVPKWPTTATRPAKSLANWRIEQVSYGPVNSTGSVTVSYQIDGALGTSPYTRGTAQFVFRAFVHGRQVQVQPGNPLTDNTGSRFDLNLTRTTTIKVRLVRISDGKVLWKGKITTVVFKA